MPDEPVACVALKCLALGVQTIEWCEKEFHCCFAWQRRRDFDRAEREAKDRRRELSSPVTPEGR
jgi:hypothetical protein